MQAAYFEQVWRVGCFGGRGRGACFGGAHVSSGVGARGRVLACCEEGEGGDACETEG